MNNRVLPLLVACVLSCAPVLAQDRDVINKKDKTKAEGTIIKETYKEITYEIEKGVKSGVPRDQVQSIDYANKPARYDDGIAKVNSGAFDDAADALDKVIKECDGGGARKLFKQHAYYYGAIANARGGHHDRALDLLNSLFTDYADTVYYVEAYNLQAECYMAASKFSEASDVAKKAVANGKAVGIPEDALVELELIKGRALEAKGLFAEAVGEYKVVVTKAARFPSVANQAKLGAGRCMVRNNDYSSAESFFNDLAEKAEDGSVLAGAYNGLGDCYRAQFEKESAPEKLRKALMAYLRGVVLYTPGRDDDTSEHARALTNAGYCFEKLKDSMPNAEGKEKYKAWARNLYRECIGSYPGSKSAEEAKKRLQNVE